MIRRGWLALITAVMLTACAGTKTYPDMQPRNLRIYGEASSGSMFSTVRAAVNIYSVDAKCRIEYQGTVRSEGRPAEVGTPAGRTSLLAVTFFSSSFLGNWNTSTRYETLLTPRIGYRYEMKINYSDDIYDVVLRELDARQSSSRELARTSADACRAS